MKNNIIKYIVIVFAIYGFISLINDYNRVDKYCVSISELPKTNHQYQYRVTQNDSFIGHLTVWRKLE
jgi:hypothetical protein